MPSLLSAISTEWKWLLVASEPLSTTEKGIRPSVESKGKEMPTPPQSNPIFLIVPTWNEREALRAEIK